MVGAVHRIYQYVLPTTGYSYRAPTPNDPANAARDTGEHAEQLRSGWLPRVAGSTAALEPQPAALGKACGVRSADRARDVGGTASGSGADRRRSARSGGPADVDGGERRCGGRQRLHGGGVNSDAGRPPVREGTPPFVSVQRAESLHCADPPRAAGIQVRVVTANAFAGRHLGDVYPHLAPFARANNLGAMCKMDEVDWSGIDVAFTCLPHAITQKAVVALPKDLKIVDLSADFRLRDADVYEQWYDTPHEAPEHLAEAGEPQLLLLVKVATLVDRGSCRLSL